LARTLSGHASAAIDHSAASADWSPSSSPSLSHATVPARITHLRAIFGSQTGTAEGFAREFADLAEDHGLTCDVIDLREFEAASELLAEDAPPTVMFLACYGMGEPTDNARGFYEWLMADERLAEKSLTEKNALWHKLRFCVFGLGNSRTHAERFCAVGVAADKRLRELGASPMAPLVYGDDSDCIEIQFDEWQTAFFSQLEEANRATADEATDSSAAPEARTPTAFSAEEANAVSNSNNASQYVSEVCTIEAAEGTLGACTTAGHAA
jgi:sulfite reductase alpha subunit-like flavoprotein